MKVRMKRGIDTSPTATCLRAATAAAALVSTPITGPLGLTVAGNAINAQVAVNEAARAGAAGDAGDGDT